MAENAPLSSCSDENLLARFRSGQRGAFDQLVHRYEAELYNYLCRYLGDATLAEDVFQNTFLQVYLKSDLFTAGRPVRPWLYTVATNQAIDALRRIRRHPAVSLHAAPPVEIDGEVHSLLEMLETAGPAPLDTLQAEEARRVVRAGVGALPDFLRQVVILAYYQGLKYRDIAEIMNIPVGTVKSRLHTALIRLQETWRETPALREEGRP